MSIGIDPSALRVYTDAELLLNLRWAVANGACGQTRNISGNVVTFPSLPDTLAAINLVEARINAAADSSGNVVLVEFA